MCVIVSGYILNSLIPKSIQVSLWSHNRNSGVLLTNNCRLSHHRFVRCFIQQAENWPEYLPGLLLHECRPSSFDYFWQWQQGEAAWEAFSKDLLLNVTATVWPKSQIKHTLFFSKLVFSCWVVSSVFTVHMNRCHLIAKDSRTKTWNNF